MRKQACHTSKRRTHQKEARVHTQGIIDLCLCLRGACTSHQSFASSWRTVEQHPCTENQRSFSSACCFDISKSHLWGDECQLPRTFPCESTEVQWPRQALLSYQSALNNLRKMCSLTSCICLSSPPMSEYSSEGFSSTSIAYKSRSMTKSQYSS